MKIIFYSHVPWNWIKQRPQFIAIELSRRFKLEFCFEKFYSTNKLMKNSMVSSDGVQLKEFFRLPFDRFLFISYLNDLIISVYFKFLVKKYDCIWFTDPRPYLRVEKNIPFGKRIIYDCMDDISEFASLKGSKLRDDILMSEGRLCERAHLVIVSSQNLYNVISEKYHIGPEKMYLMNNALDLNFLNQAQSLPGYLEDIFNDDKRKGLSVFTYVGTISSWFDIRSVLDMLDLNHNIIFYLFGPAEVPVPEHDRLKYLGVLEHKYVASALLKSDVLVLPFLVNELVKSVNPVKMYEYVASRKPVLSCEYQELSQFRDYVHFYNPTISLSNLAKNVLNGKITKPSASENFAVDNSWQTRVEKLIKFF